MDRGATGSSAIDEEEKGLTRAKRQRLGMLLSVVGDQVGALKGLLCAQLVQQLVCSDIANDTA